MIEKLVNEVIEMIREKNEMAGPGSERMLEDGVSLEMIRPTPETAEVMGAQDHIIGDPETDMENWHLQTEANSCAIACQEFVAEQLLDAEFSEKDMIKAAREKGWYNPEIGTTPNDVGKLLEAVGLEAERGSRFSVADLAGELETEGKVIVGVNNMVLHNPEYADLPGISANHAVQVIGFAHPTRTTYRSS